jgi:Thrombospondin type 3 repeat
MADQTGSLSGGARMGIRALGAAALCLGLALPAGAKTLLVLDSEGGDAVGQGLFQQLTDLDGSFGAQRNASNGVSVTFTGSDSWSLDFSAPGDVDLVTQLYPGATRYPFQSPTVPGLDVSGAGRGCGELTGAFRVLEIAYGAGSAVDSFAADFVQSCEGSTKKLIGAIRFNASDALPDLQDDDADGVGDIGDNCEGTANADQRDTDFDGAGDVCDPDLEASFVLFDSQAGDYIGQGLRQHFDAANAEIRVDRNNDGGVTFHVDGSDSWTLDFTGAGGGQVDPGVYEGATRYPFNGPTEPGLDVSGAGRGCNSLSGRFEVFEAEYAGNGDVLRFSADFEQHCEGGAPALLGSVRYRAAFRPVPKDLDGDGWLDKQDACPGVANPAQWPDDACGLTPAEQKCVYELNKRGAALLKLQNAQSRACLKNAAKGKTVKLGTPATAEDCLGNDVGGKMERAAGKLEAREEALCGAVDPAFGATDSFSIEDAAVEQGAGLVADLFGADLDAAVTPAAADPLGAKCQGEVAKRSTSALDALLALTVKQKKLVLAGKKVLAATDDESLGAMLLGNVEADPKGRASKPFAALAGGIAKKCGGVDLAAAFPGCATADAGALGACAERAVRCRFCLALDAFDDLGLDCDAFDDGDDGNLSCD